MRILDNPKHGVFPKECGSNQSKIIWLSNAKHINVGCFGFLIGNDFQNYFLPRIRGLNFKYKEEKYGAKTFLEAYIYGLELREQWKQQKEIGSARISK